MRTFWLLGAWIFNPVHPACAYITEIFLENIFKYQNDHSYKFGGAIIAQYGGILNYFMFTIDLVQTGSRDHILVIAMREPRGCKSIYI